VDARDGDDPLPLIEGPVVPQWVGAGDPEAGWYAGLPGTAWAKVLREEWTGVMPTGAYWNHTRIAVDNRIPALQSSSVELRFDASEAEAPQVESRLLFRRAYRQLAAWKSWDVPDLVLDERSIPVTPTP
jgi:hypothetical protein